ncbi:hypothetical protein ABQW55_023185 (plasmid) [Xanthomonas citri pv. malvacearum]|uniref:Uncharacterized protein n=1 Tax=Xanthomonas euvesicatoria TaxID=456327 RepID=A0A6B3KKG8_XANEU|nr:MULTISPECIES: hypothetical protein [Xanthomonas]MBV6787505.1 hypothetical protein [Xanthomonas campestris pv. uppalii]MBV6898191.1 hypothetical protein [Xanthomonas campestris pv. ionidii]MCC8761139.1 hypothetical protein [Xanthomonas euvesicatoria pv. euvesicatoria]MCC8788467.1 hypothetical protein [Xanthomonas euvesicatoria pv. euvesicatoria]MDM4814594.1 hypothetical protein [Xanthomonas euvesicatoria]
MSARVLAAIVLAAVSLAGCTAQPAGKSCEQTLTCEAPEVLPKSVPAKCGCALLFDAECRALIDRIYGKSAAANLQTRLNMAQAYGDAAQRACPAPGQEASPGKQKRSDAFTPSTVKPAKPIGEWW